MGSQAGTSAGMPRWSLAMAAAACAASIVVANPAVCLGASAAGAANGADVPRGLARGRHGQLCPVLHGGGEGHSPAQPGVAGTSYVERAVGFLPRCR